MSSSKRASSNVGKANKAKAYKDACEMRANPTACTPEQLKGANKLIQKSDLSTALRSRKLAAIADAKAALWFRSYAVGKANAALRFEVEAVRTAALAQTARAEAELHQAEGKRNEAAYRQATADRARAEADRAHAQVAPAQAEAHRAQEVADLSAEAARTKHEPPAKKQRTI